MREDDSSGDGRCSTSWIYTLLGSMLWGGQLTVSGARRIAGAIVGWAGRVDV